MTSEQADSVPVSVPVTRYEWERILRRVRVPKLPPAQAKQTAGAETVKYVGFVLASYADHDGTRVRPGLIRLAAVTGCSQSTVKRAVRRLVDLGLLECLSTGSNAGRRAWASTYRLTVPQDLMERIEMLPPSELPAANNPEQGARALRTGGAGAPLPTQDQPLPPPTHWLSSTVTPPTREGPVDNPGPVLRSSLPDPDPPPPDLAPLPAPGPAPDTGAPVLAEKCPHGLRPRYRPDGSLWTCFACRRGIPALYAVEASA